MNKQIPNSSNTSAPEFKNQGGVSQSDPSVFLRWLSSTVMTYLFSQKRTQKRHAKAEKQRIAQGKAHQIEYFHQINDGYSHLAAQVLKPLAQRYNVDIVCHLVEGPSGANLPEPDLLLKLARVDAAAIAPEYNLTFPKTDQALSAELVSLASSILATLDDANFINCAAKVSDALWSGDTRALKALAEQYGTASEHDLNQRIEKGTQRRKTLKHYSGAMFYYGGEWYWGVDRLYHLEKRLAAFGADKQPNTELIIDRPSDNAGELKGDGDLTLEFYGSLRSPYTAICFDRAVELAKNTEINFVLKPILPMVMRGVPATLDKGLYIFMDTAREAHAAGVDYGKFKDPIGDPVRNAYSLYPWVKSQGKDIAFFSSFLNCAFAQGVNTNSNAGLKKVIEQAGLNWQEAKSRIGTNGWQDTLEQNRTAMYEQGLWGVPCFRLLDKNNEQIMAVWGQDRLWLVAREIQRQIARST